MEPLVVRVETVVENQCENADRDRSYSRIREGSGLDELPDPHPRSPEHPVPNPPSGPQLLDDHPVPGLVGHGREIDRLTGSGIEREPQDLDAGGAQLGDPLLDAGQGQSDPLPQIAQGGILDAAVPAGGPERHLETVMGLEKNLGEAGLLGLQHPLLLPLHPLTKGLLVLHQRGAGPGELVDPLILGLNRLLQIPESGGASVVQVFLPDAT